MGGRALLRFFQKPNLFSPYYLPPIILCTEKVTCLFCRIDMPFVKCPGNTGSNYPWLVCFCYGGGVGGPDAGQVLRGSR